MTRLEQVATALIKPSYRFITKIGVSSHKNKDGETFYEITLHVDPNILKRYFRINPNLLDALERIKKHMVDTPFEHFTQIADENDGRSMQVVKNITQSIKKDFYLARKMAGIDYPSGLANLRIVFN